jgi:catechol 2,3-dioxygenase-like lactoylglutathione lyase family enzyme
MMLAIRPASLWRRFVTGVNIGFPKWIGVVCSDFEAQRHFYRDVLGFRETALGDDWAQFDIGPGVAFEIVAQSSAPEYDQPRYQVGFVVDDIHAAREELISRGIEPVSDVLGDSPFWAYFRDPEGNVFEITERA